MARKPPAPPPEVTPTEDRRARLLKLRDQFEAALVDCSPNMLPQLGSQYRATLAELAALPPVKEKSARERLAERVAAADVVA